MSKDIAERTRRLVNVAMGRLPADLVVRKGKWISVQTGEILPDSDVAVSGEHIAYVGPDASHTIGENTRVIEAEGRFITPGLLDGHMHVEGGSLTITEFVKSVIPYGTTGMFIDPHEFANVFGLEGVRLMAEEADLQPIHVWVQMPSCVPSAPGMETPGASISEEDVVEAMNWPRIIGLGEMMNFPGVTSSDPKMHAEMAAARKSNKVIGGHYASPDLGIPFHAYAAGGPQDDHEGTRFEDAVARARQGMKPMLRLGSGWHDVAEGVRAITELKMDPRHFILCTDDSHADTLVNEGHVDRAVREAIRCGVNPITAIQMTTINTAEHFGLDREIGQIAPGRFADLLLVKDLVNFKAELVIARGKVVAEQGKLRVTPPKYQYPDWVVNSIHVERQLNAQDFVLKSPQDGPLTANVIGVMEFQAPTQHLRYKVQAENGQVDVDLERDIIKVGLVERHKGSGRVQVGLVHGFGITQPCAIATTMAHDSHNIVMIGTRDEDMALAANHLSKIGGGQVVVLNGKVIGELKLPIAGLMSNLPAEEVASQSASILSGFQACGCSLNSPNMQLSLLALVVIPELRISDLGLVDVNTFSFIPVLELA